jgi:hypothetical protein
MLNEGDRVIYTGLENGQRMPGRLIRMYLERPPGEPPDVTGLTHYVIKLDDYPEPIDIYRRDLFERESADD